jgi:uncharacterized protein (TIGR00369 family)
MPASPSLAFAAEIPFVDLLGFQLVRFDGGHARVDCELRAELTNSYGVAHGGLSMTLLDVAMAHAARSPDQPGGEVRQGVVTVEMKTTFMRPGEGRLSTQASVLHRSATMSFCEGRVMDAQGRLVAHATGTFKHVRGLPGSAPRGMSSST